MKKFLIQTFFLLIIIFGGLYLSYHPDVLSLLLGSKVPVPAQQFSLKKLQIDQNIINIETADTAAKRQQGLSGRENMATESGMLFVFPETKKFQFWMKGMKFPLDLIFINNGKVVDLIKQVPIPTTNTKDNYLPIYEPVIPINMMLEVNGGYIDSHNIRIGDSVSLLDQ